MSTAKRNLAVRSGRVSAVVPWHGRLGARILVFVLLIVALSLGAVLMAASEELEGYSLGRSQSDMQAARTAFERLAIHRAESSAQQCRLIVELPIFRSMIDNAAVLSEKDNLTIGAMSEEYRQELGAGFCLVTDGKSHWLGHPVGLTQVDSAGLRDAIRTALAGQEYRRIVDLSHRPYLVVSEPARFAEETLGTLTAGYPLNDEWAGELARVTGCAVSFLAPEQVWGSSLRTGAASPPAALQSLTRAAPSWTGSAALHRLDGVPYVAAVYPLPSALSDRTACRLALLQPWKPTERVLRQVEYDLLLIGVGAFALAVLGAVVVGQRMARPLHDLATAAEAVAAGDWESEVPVPAIAEAALTARAFNEMTRELRHYYADSQSKTERLTHALEQVQELYRATVLALCRALDARDNETEGHSERVAYYALRLARQLRLDEDGCDRLEWGALLHDIGKIGVPDSILRKPGRLTSEEMEMMRRHCEIGMAIVRSVPGLERSAEIIRCHHEWFNGCGYPQGLQGQEIPLTARIFAVADALDAITSDRPYRSAQPFRTALAEIRRCAGIQFDPEIVAALEEIGSNLEEWRSRNERVGYAHREVAGAGIPF